MSNKILIKRSTVVDKVPTELELNVGELAVNTADAKIYTKHSTGDIIVLADGKALSALVLAIIDLQDQIDAIPR